MERADAFRLGSYKKFFIDKLREEGFEYRDDGAVTYPGLKEPEVASITPVDVCGAYLIIPRDNENNDAKTKARQRLRDLASKF